jgi:hypothetical protein
MVDDWRGEFPLGGSADQVAIGENLDGRLEVFYVGTNSGIYHNWQTAPNGVFWEGEIRFAGDSAKQVAVGRNTDGRLEIFYVGTNNGLYHNWQTVSGGEVWAGEIRFAGDSAKQVVVGQNQDGRLEIFYVGTNDDLYHNWQTAPGSQIWAGETRFASDSAKQVAVGQNQDGRLEIFYVGGNNDLYHNWQTASNSHTWAGETRFAGDSAQQIAAARNIDGSLEIFYVGTNGKLYRNVQSAANSLAWRGETGFANDSAKQIAVGANADGRLEIFYVGTNNDIYHNWQVAPIRHFGSNFNQILFSDCNPLLGVSVTIDVTEAIVCNSTSGPTMGFGFQLNAYSPKNEKSAWQQYVISVFGSQVVGAVDNWPLAGDNIINDFFDMVSLPSDGIAAGYVLKITLSNDSRNNVTGATYVVIDDRGKTISTVKKTLTDFSGVTSADIAPIIAFELNLVGPVNSESVVLSSGAGKITYQATTPLTALDAEPTCAESGYVTAETANSLYSALPTGANTQLSQTFSIAKTESLVIRKEGKIRPSLVIPPDIRQRLPKAKG